MRRVIGFALLMLCGGLVAWGDSATAPTPVKRGQDETTGTKFHEMSDCSSFPPGALDLLHNIKLPGPITCDNAERILIIPEGYNIVVKADGAMEFKRVHFFVAPGARLTLAAESGITVERHEELEGVALFEVAGELIVHAGGQWSPTRNFPDEFAVPRTRQQHLLVKNGRGVVYSGEDIAFGKNSITVSAATHEKAKEKATDEGGPQDLHNSRAKTLGLGQILHSDDAAHALWVGEHGSVFFSGDRTKHHGDHEPITLIPANEGKVNKMLQIRKMLAHEEATGGGHAEKSRSWTPWGRAFDRRVLRSRQHAGEVQLTVDHCGCLEVTVDGSCVLTKSGPFRWEWVNWCLSCGRPTSADYALRVVSDGMEVECKGKKIWGVSVP